MLTGRFSRTELLQHADELDAGFDSDVFADMIDNVRRYSDVDLALGGTDVTQLREFFIAWLAERRSS
jgi:hypothetical protein